MTTSQILGQHLALLRQDAGLTQEEAAEKAGLHSRTITKIELGETNPNLSTLEDLARAYGVDLGKIFDPWTRSLQSPEKPITDVLYKKLKKIIADGKRGESLIMMITAAYKELR